MRPTSKTAQKIMEKLTVGLKEPGDHAKFDNASGSYMAVSVSAMNKIKEGLIISIAHYGKQNGDLMADPYI